MANRYGSYDYDQYGVILESYPEARSAKLRQSETAGRDGMYTGGGLVAGTRLVMSGVLKVPAVGTPNIRQLWRQFVAAHNPGSPSPLTLEYFGADRFLYAEVESWQEVQGSPPVVDARQFEVNFSLADPFWYSQTEKTRAMTTGVAANLDYDGTVYGVPTIDAVVTQPGTVTITHESGDQFSLVASLPGTYSINTRQGFVSRAGGYHNNWDGVFPRIDEDNPQLLMSITAPGTVTATVRWRDRD